MTGPEKAHALRQRKGRQRIAALTAYDYPTARLVDESGIDLLLVGDSLGMVVLGFPDTTHVSMEHMLHHTRAVARARPTALLLADLPIHSYPDPPTALDHARQLLDAGAEAVKLEGGCDQAATVATLTAAGIPVCGHLGMLPQQVQAEGGYRKKGRTPTQIRALQDDATALVAAGVFAIVLESVTPTTAAKLTREIPVPTIGIGCGETTCDGEVAVITDLIGSFPWFVPPFAKPEANLASTLQQAVTRYTSRVHQAP